MLTNKTKYAIHALSFLGKRFNKGKSLINEISQSENIPKKFLEHILLELKKNGLLGSKTGVGGGYYLLIQPSEIPLSRVLRLFEGPIALAPCVSLNYYQKCDACKDEVTCGLKKVMIDIRDETLKILERKTIQDVMNEEKLSHKI